MHRFDKFKCGMGIGGWLTNYKRFNVLPEHTRNDITIGDMEHFREYITEWDIENIKNMGFDHVRLGFDQIVLESQPYVYRDEIFGIIGSFIGWCEKHGLGVVLNLHKAVGNYCDIREKVALLDDGELQNRVVALWEELERRFHSKPDVAFELLNEVLDVDPEKWNDFAERLISSIRKFNKDRMIIVGSTCWNSPKKLQYLRVYDDENVIYTFHCYAPNEFTHQRGVLQWQQLWYNRKLEYPSDDIERYRDFHRLMGNDNSYAGYERMDKQFLWDFLDGARLFKAAHPGKILWNGEFGTIRHADINSRINYMRDVIGFCVNNDIPYCVWNYLSTPNDGNRFSLVDDDTRAILSPELLATLKHEA